MDIQLIIERTNDGFYSVTTLEYESLPFFVFGEGSTIEEAKADFMNVLKDMATEEHFDTSGLTFSYSYNAAAQAAVSETH